MPQRKSIHLLKRKSCSRSPQAATSKKYHTLAGLVWQQNGTLPEEFITVFKEKDLNIYGEAVEAAVNKLGKTKNEIVDAMTNDGHLIKGN